MDCEARLARKCLSMPTFLTYKVGQTDLIFGVWLGFINGLCVQDYKSVCAAVTICSTLVNIQTDVHMHTQTYSILTSLYEKLSQLS